MEAKGLTLTIPRTGTPTELRRVGVVVLSRREQLLKCLRCEAVWRMTAWLSQAARQILGVSEWLQWLES